MSCWLQEILFKPIDRIWLILEFFIKVEPIGSSAIAALRGGQSLFLLWFWVVVDDFGYEFGVFFFVEVFYGAAQHFLEAFYFFVELQDKHVLV
jgi:hypothetical protein